MAGKPGTPKSKSELGSAAGYKRVQPSTKGVRTNVNNKNVKVNPSLNRNSKSGK
jgi:hypothetical protein